MATNETRWQQIGDVVARVAARFDRDRVTETEDFRAHTEGRAPARPDTSIPHELTVSGPARICGGGE